MSAVKIPVEHVADGAAATVNALRLRCQQKVKVWQYSSIGFGAGYVFAKCMMSDYDHFQKQKTSTRKITQVQPSFAFVCVCFCFCICTSNCISTTCICFCNVTCIAISPLKDKRWVQSRRPKCDHYLGETWKWFSVQTKQSPRSSWTYLQWWRWWWRR